VMISPRTVTDSADSGDFTKRTVSAPNRQSQHSGFWCT